MTNPNAGALSWEQACSNAKTCQRVIPILSASPNGVVYAPAGYVVTTEAGVPYIKTTPGTVNTGWESVSINT